ncbi:MAG: hypothetical protein ACRDV1_09015 [Actinomycetes bacterium]
MKIFTPSTTCLTGCRAAVADATAHTDVWGTTPTSRPGIGVRVVAPFATRLQGITVPSARQRTVATATALLPNSETVMTDGISGIRSWSPPD